MAESNSVFLKILAGVATGGILAVGTGYVSLSREVSAMKSQDQNIREIRDKVDYIARLQADRIGTYNKDIETIRSDVRRLEDTIREFQRRR